MSEVIVNDVTMTFDELMDSIIGTLDFVETNTTNIFIIKKCAIIDIKLEEIRARKYNMIETVDSICASIISKDISNMKGVLDQSSEMYDKYNELEEKVNKITSVYTPL